MPIYAYRCSACGHAQDVLQKISDPVLVRCTACGADAFQKQVTAAGFQLKGSGWYVTDFRGNGAKDTKGGADTQSGKDTGAASPAGAAATPAPSAAAGVEPAKAAASAPAAPAATTTTSGG